uniref:Retrotransposon gag domain-containing protein n=1 Tax=Fagus sylvatica TaxID=28930 RepID=A0A2N9ENL4_FAGSY
MEHISKFLDSMGPFAAHGDLCLREFSKSLVDRAYTWYTVLPAGSIRTWEDMVESFCSKYFHVEGKDHPCQSAWHQAADWRRPGEVHPPLPGRVFGLSCEVSRGGASRGTRRVCRRLSLCPPQPHLAVPNERIQQKRPASNPLQKNRKIPSIAATIDTYITPRWTAEPSDGRSTVKSKMVPYKLSEEQQKVHKTPFPNYNKGKGKAVVSVVIHGNVSDMEAEESAAASSSLVPAAVRTLQKSPKFKSLFNQLGFGPEARNAATEALITIAAESGATCFTAEAHA